MGVKVLRSNGHWVYKVGKQSFSMKEWKAKEAKRFQSIRERKRLIASWENVAGNGI
jgi:hypothetical protein